MEFLCVIIERISIQRLINFPWTILIDNNKIGGCCYDDFVEKNNIIIISYVFDIFFFLLQQCYFTLQQNIWLAII